jgi:hypothetical protein
LASDKDTAAQGAELDADQHIVAGTAVQRVIDQHLIVAHAVEVAGVEQSIPGVQCGMDRSDALGAVSWAVEVVPMQPRPMADQPDRYYRACVRT